MKTLIELSKAANKQIKKLPKHIVEALLSWIRHVEIIGLEETRKIKGYHDEPLSGLRKGQRSVRLSKSYRVIYSVTEDEVRVIMIEEVNKHLY